MRLIISLFTPDSTLPRFGSGGPATITPWTDRHHQLAVHQKAATPTACHQVWPTNQERGVAVSA